MQYVMLCNSIGRKGINFYAKQQIYLQKCFEKGKGKLKVLHLMIVEQGWCDGGQCGFDGGVLLVGTVF